MQDETPKRKVQIDASIFRRIQQGEQEAFRELYDVTYKPLYAFLLSYTLNKEEKTITITADESGFQKLADQSQGQYTEEEIRNVLESVVTTFDYSVDQERLTLTEREYGEQLVLVKE